MLPLVASSESTTNGRSIFRRTTSNVVHSGKRIARRNRFAEHDDSGTAETASVNMSIPTAIHGLESPVVGAFQVLRVYQTLTAFQVLRMFP